MIVLLPVVFPHAPPLVLQQYSYDVIDPLLMSGGTHATKSTGGVIDIMCTDTEFRGILAGTICKGKKLIIIDINF